MGRNRKEVWELKHPFSQGANPVVTVLVNTE
uniref:Uncharacterized protein n=1 Tax=Anguilla anguilla TaxID=7936 RepID=A0A0E9UM04_ANGAN